MTLAVQLLMTGRVLDVVMHACGLQNRAKKDLPAGSLIDKASFAISEEITRSWQNMVTNFAELLNVPAVLVTRLEDARLEILCANVSRLHPFKAGDHDTLVGSYCEEVIRSGSVLRVSNALDDERWKTNPDISPSLISYLGVPLFWPDGEVFGTICILDSKTNAFEERYERLLTTFKTFAEMQLSFLYRNFCEQANLESILDSLSEGVIAHDSERRIEFFNRAAELITGYRREEVLGKDCHEVFSGPFCGGRCSFQDGAAGLTETVYYPLNIISKTGEPRRIEMAVTSRLAADGREPGVIASFRDVTALLGLQLRSGELTSFAGIIGRDPKMLQVYRQIRALATNDYPVCITGETGTGKELVAQAIHNESRRGGGPFVPVNCAALPDGILESELFGHVKGAFTGALRDKKGRFELAHGGTLFLDEVGDLPAVVQAKLLRVLQEGAFERVGDERTVSVNVRIVSATNRDLKQMVTKGQFRDDLYYRLSVVPLELPPLRRRKNDIPLLVEYFLDKAGEEGQTVSGISPEAMNRIREYAWPGNIRELQSAIRYAVVNSRGRVIQIDNLPMELRNIGTRHSYPGPARKLDMSSVRAALQQTGGNKAKAARVLGVGRATLYRFLADGESVS
nr:sigma 54-interacting transcriptional regulator [Deltaproteobacteria bacterium]